GRRFKSYLRKQNNAVRSKTWRRFAFAARVAKERRANPKHVKGLRALPAIPCDTDATRECAWCSRGVRMPHHVAPVANCPRRRGQLCIGGRLLRHAEDCDP